MKIDEEQVFVLTNPLFYIWAVLLLIYKLIIKAIEFLGLNDWYFVLFNWKTMPLEAKKQMAIMMDNRTTKLFWLKLKAWEWALAKIKKEELI